MKNNIKQKNIVVGLLCAIVLLMAIGYAAFSTVLNIKGTTNITSNFSVEITGIRVKNINGSASNKMEPTFTNTTATFKVGLVKPGDSIEYEIIVSNTGNLNAKLDKITLSNTNNSAINFSTNGLVEGDELMVGKSALLNVIVEYDASVTSQPDITISDLTVNLQYSQITGSVPSEPGITVDELKTSVVTTGDGLYKDSTEAGRYVYRGTNPDNYLTFNGEDAGWRIVSIEADNTLKIIKIDSLGYKSFDDANVRTALYCSYGVAGCNVWGSKSTMLNSSGGAVTQLAREVNGVKYDLPVTEATLNTYLNNDYINTLNDEAKDLIISHKFNTGVLLKSDVQTLNVDMAQVKSSMWKGKFGLIEISDYIKSSTSSICTSVYKATEIGGIGCKSSNYLFDSSYYWSLTPYSSNDSSDLWRVIANGGVSNGHANYKCDIRPVTHIKPDVNLRGKGTIDNPYIIYS